MEQTFRAVFENGVLRPLRPLRLKEKSRVVITLYQESHWQDDFIRLRRVMKARSEAIPQQAIEEEVTRASAEVKAKRHAARRAG